MVRKESVKGCFAGERDGLCFAGSIFVGGTVAICHGGSEAVKLEWSSGIGGGVEGK